MKLQCQQKSKSNSRNGSTSKRFDQFSSNDDFSRNGFGDKRNSLNSQTSGKSSSFKEKSLTTRLYERVLILQNHVDNISSQTANYEPQFLEFQQQYEQLMKSMSLEKPQEELKVNQIPLKEEDFNNIQTSYSGLTLDLQKKTASLNSQCQQISHVLSAIEDQISFQKDQSSILIQESELKLKEYFLLKAAEIDNTIDQDSQMFTKDYIDAIKEQMEFNHNENLSQLEVIEGFLNQLEEEWDQRIIEVENQVTFINEAAASQTGEQYKDLDEVREWMIQQTNEIARRCEKEAQEMIELQLQKLNYEKEQSLETSKQDIAKIQGYVKRQSSSCSKENVQDNMQRISSASIRSNATTVSSQNNRTKLKQVISQGLLDLETFEAFVLNSSEIISTKQEEIIKQSKKGVFADDSRVQQIKKETQVRFEKCKETIQDLSKTQEQMIHLKKRLLDQSLNVNRTLLSNKEEFSSIDIFMDHFEALKRHVENTHTFLLKQFQTVKLHLQS